MSGSDDDNTNAIKHYEEGDVRIEAIETAFQGFFQIRRYRFRHTLFAGGWSGEIVRELFERGHAAAVMPYDPWRDTVVMIEQFRVGALHLAEGPWLKEFVAGMIEPGETSEAVVLREAEEEAGCVIDLLEPICDYLVSPGGTSEMISLYCGRTDSASLGGLHGIEEENEDIRASVVAADDAFAMMGDGVFKAATPIIALQWLQRHRDRLRREWR